MTIAIKSLPLGGFFFAYPSELKKNVLSKL